MKLFVFSTFFKVEKKRTSLFFIKNKQEVSTSKFISIAYKQSSFDPNV